ncbi:4-hydroxy-tetrahydrodipicolinate reductase [Crocinitomix catalasitica]|uniref:4-hydroxy-tetrahydrodipicolinate reductase n=1 Tax=Crocinitomix catalasitica TaxID=184607 RepID=UPI000B082B2A|nr:4-hydroxy-tetrahydrodipicolinate reductase [Crocinitomix catalasitica]
MIRIALFGYGKMGKEIESIAVAQGHQITAKVSSTTNLDDLDVNEIDVIIEFSNPTSVLKNIDFAFNNNIPIVVGTTGWYEKFDDVVQKCKAHKGSIIHATNFSVGVNLFFALNSYLAKLMAPFKEYETTVKEVHHTEKLDSPSGTGISIAEQILNERSDFSGWENVKKTEISVPSALSIESLRIPNVPGTHHVKYESDVDEIEITHLAHSRKGFATGSIIAAQWLLDKKGVFTMKDVLNF